MTSTKKKSRMKEDKVHVKKPEREDWPELEESDDNKNIETMSVQDLRFGDSERPENPTDGRKETTQRGWRWVKRDLMVVWERTSVDGGGGRLLLEKGEEGESDEGQPYVYGGGSQKTLWVHLPTLTFYLFAL